MLCQDGMTWFYRKLIMPEKEIRICKNDYSSEDVVVEKVELYIM